MMEDKMGETGRTDWKDEKFVQGIR